MSGTLDHVLNWAARQLPEGENIWISDLRYEARHIEGRLSRLWFLWSGVLAATGQVLRHRVGVQRIGQMLIGFALLTLCVGGLLIAQNMPDDIVKTTFYGALILYALVGGLFMLDLNLTKRFTLLSAVCLLTLSFLFGMNIFPVPETHAVFLGAFALEAGCIMAGLTIAARYLGWVEDASHG